MKRMIYGLLVIVAFLITGNNALAQNRQDQVILNGTNVRLRLEPNLQCGWLKDAKGQPIYLKKGTKLTYLGESGDFYQVKYEGKTLYVSKKFAYRASEGQPQQSSAAQPSRPTPKENASTAKGRVVLTGTSVRLRKGPGTSYDYLKRKDGSPRYLNPGASLKYLGEEGGFYKCSFEGQTVYVSKQFARHE